MLRYVGRRLLSSIPTVILLAIGLFVLVRVIPGDPAISLIGENATLEQVAWAREKYGLDQPIYIQFFYWLGGLLQGDLGNSIQLGLPVSDLILARIPVTFTLALFAIIITIVIAVPLGLAAAARKGSILDSIALTGSVAGVSIPSFFIGMMLILVFAVQLGLFPSFSYRPFADGFLPALHGYVLPAVTLSTLYVAIVLRMSRASMLEVLSQDYIVTARASGFSRRRVLYRHALRNALIPVVTVVGLNFGALLAGSIITERVFTLPGIGSLLLSAIDRRDYPVIQSVVLLVSLTYIVVNLLTDVLYAYLDPRIRRAHS